MKLEGGLGFGQAESKGLQAGIQSEPKMRLRRVQGQHSETGCLLVEGSKVESGQSVLQGTWGTMKVTPAEMTLQWTAGPVVAVLESGQEYPRPSLGAMGMKVREAALLCL